MSLLIENLMLFNRKERFHLFAEALGLSRSGIKLDQDFRNRLGEITGLKVPELVFLAIDYHLDWIYAALYFSNMNRRVSDIKWQPKSPSDKLFSRGPKDQLKVSRTPQDIDLLIAYDVEGDTTQLLLIEAKFDTSWSNEQLKEKSEHLKNIFGPKNDEWADIATPHFLIASPREPLKVGRDVLPEWARAHKRWWIEIGGLRDIQDPSETLVRIGCCNIDGEDSKEGEFWKVL